MPGETNIYVCGCAPMPGTQPPAIAPYVVSLEGLQGIITFGDTGSIVWRTEENTIYADFTPSAGLGSVTSVAVASNNSNLSVVSGSPVTTSGTITLSLSGNIGSISGLVMAADQMVYSTAADTFAATSLTSFARTLLDDANNTAARSTLGLVIGTDVQAWSADLDSFVSNVSWSGANATFAGNILVSGALDVLGSVQLSTNLDVGIDATITGNLTVGTTITGDGSGISGINASNLASGTVAVARGGTNISSYATGDLIYASGATTLAKLADVSAGSYLRSGGVTTAPLWSTLKLPNSATAGDLFYGSSSNTMGNLADVAAGNVLLSGGVGVAPAYGKVTSTHTDGTTIATLSGGGNSNIITMTGLNTITTSQLSIVGTMSISGGLVDGGDTIGNLNDILVSNGAGFNWTSQISVSTLSVSTNISVTGTLTPGGTTGAQTINKPCGTVRFAAAGATSIVVTNSLSTTNHRVHVTVCTNDTTLHSCWAVTTNGAFTIYANAAATAECEVFWTLIQVT